MPRKKPGTDPKPKGIEIPPRNASGHVEPPADRVEPIAPTLLKRLKDEVLPRAKDKRLGTVLGIMHLQGILTEAEAEAGMRYAEDVGAYERSMGHPARSAHSPSWEGGFKGGGLDLDALKRMDSETAEKLERRIRRKRKAIQKRYDRAQACIPEFPHHAGTILEEVCCNDRPVPAMHYAGLRQILRNLAVHYGIALPTDSAPRPRTSRKADAALLAQGTIDAAQAWFDARRSVVTHYRLATPSLRNRQIVTPAFTAYGHTKDGEALEYTIRHKRSGLMIEEINAQLVKAAEERGWKPSGTSQKEVA